MELNGIPVYKVTLSDDTVGMFGVALVTDPAMESKFLAFNKEGQKTAVMMSILSEDKRLVHGVLIRADFPILRMDENGKPFYVTFSKEVIREIAERYVFNGFTSNFDLDHDHAQVVDGINLVQLYIKDVAKGVDPKGYEDIEDGSLFAEYKVHNDSVWAQIKKGVWTAFSLEAIVRTSPKEEPVIETVEDLLDYLNKS